MDLYLRRRICLFLTSALLLLAWQVVASDPVSPQMEKVIEADEDHANDFQLRQALITADTTMAFELIGKAMATYARLGREDLVFEAHLAFGKAGLRFGRYRKALGSLELAQQMAKTELQIDGPDVLIIEGLHALNDELTSSIDSKIKYKIYISPLTSINLDNHNRISMSDNRLLRRMIRDNRMRGYTANMTLSKWQDVREGEEKYVFPYQDSADVIFNTSLLYELGVLRLYAEPLLFSVSEKDPYYGEAIRLINVLRNVLPTTSDNIPLDSIIREFIGNSYFEKTGE